MPLTSRMSLMEVTQSAVVDLQESLAFSEPFYVVVVEKENEPEQKQNESLDFLDVPSHAAQNDGSEGNCVQSRVILKNLDYFFITIFKKMQELRLFTCGS